MKSTALALAASLAFLFTACAGARKTEAETIDDVLDGPTVTVLDEAGGAVADAEVWIVDRLTLRADAAVVASRMTGDWVETALSIATEVRRTDGRGRATFDVIPKSGVLVAARRGPLFGGVELGAIGTSDVEVRLRPRPTYRVRVSDADGAPAAGVPMSLAVPRGDRLERLAATAFTDEDGLAVIYEPPVAAFPPRQRKDRGTERVAVARIATRELLQVRVDPVGTAELRLPLTGTVVLSATHSGFPAEHWRGVIQLFAAKDGSRSEITLAEPLGSGGAVVDHVEVGVDLRCVLVLAEKDDASNRLIGTHSQRLLPLAEQGEEAGRVLILDGGALFEGRVVDTEGEPIVGAALDLLVQGFPATSWTLITGADGAFRWLVTGATFSGDGFGGLVVELESGRVAATVSVPSDAAGPVISLGTIELR